MKTPRDAKRRTRAKEIAGPTSGISTINHVAIPHLAAIRAGGPPVGKGWEFWERYDRMIIRCCSGMFVLMQEGWTESVGVRAEMRYASEVGIPVKMLEAEEAGVG